MQSVVIQGLDKVIKALDEMPDVILAAKADAFEVAGQELLADVQRRIGGTGRVAGVQEYQVGSGKGYVAVRAKKKTELDGYAAGYITNALENGHDQEPGRFVPEIGRRLKEDRVAGKYMYRDVGESRAIQAADNIAKCIETAAVEALNGDPENVKTSQTGEVNTGSDKMSIIGSVSLPSSAPRGLAASMLYQKIGG